MSHSGSHTEHEEVTINSLEGLQLFLENIRDIHRDVLSSALRTAVDTELCERFEKTYAHLREKIHELKTNLSTGITVTHSDANDVQRMYDRLVQLHTQLKKSVQSHDHSVEHPILPVESQNDTADSNELLSLAHAPANHADSKIVSVMSDQLHHHHDEPRKKKRRRKKKRNTLEMNGPDSGVSSQSKELSILDSAQQLVDVKERAERLQLSWKKMYESHHEGSVAEQILLDEARETYDLARAIQHDAATGFSDVAQLVARLKRAELHMHEIKKALREVTDDTRTAERISKKMDIADGDDEVIVPIRSVTAAQTPTTFVPTSVTTAVRENPIKRNIPKELVSLPRTNSVHENDSLTARYLTAPVYTAFISERFSSPDGFERILDATITKLEAATIDGIERWLGEVRASAFEYLKEMQVVEIVELSGKGYDYIQTLLQKENIKYETFVMWMDIFDEMKEALQPPAHITFGELFATYMIEVEMQSVAE